MTLGEECIRRMVGLMQRVFYPETVGAGDVAARPFYEDLRLLRMAATYGAAHIRDYGTGEFSLERYEEIFREIVQKVALHGTPAAQMRRRGAYLAKAVQDHWRHHWEEYAGESKKAGAAVERELAALLKRGQMQAGQAERPMAMLAAVHDALKTGRPKSARPTRPAKPREIQEELF